MRSATSSARSVSARTLPVRAAGPCGGGWVSQLTPIRRKVSFYLFIYHYSARSDVKCRGKDFWSWKEREKHICRPIWHSWHNPCTTSIVSQCQGKRLLPGTRAIPNHLVCLPIDTYDHIQDLYSTQSAKYVRYGKMIQSHNQAERADELQCHRKYSGWSIA